MFSDGPCLFEFVLLSQHVEDSLGLSANLAPDQDIIDVKQNHTQVRLPVSTVSKPSVDRRIDDLREALALKKLTDFTIPGERRRSESVNRFLQFHKDKATLL